MTSPSANLSSTTILMSTESTTRGTTRMTLAAKTVTVTVKESK